MTPDERKKRATELLLACDVGDVTAVAKLINDDFHFKFMERVETWSVEGKEISTTLDKENFLKYGVTAAKNVTKDGMHFKVDMAICDGNVVALFGESQATSLKGNPYNNTYCWRFVFSGDKVSDWREYCDTHHSHQVLFD